MVADQKLVFKQYATLINNNKTENQGPKIGKRHIQTLLVLLIIIMNYVMRISMSVIIVAMTDSTASINRDIPTYNWTDKSLIMAAFMWGYMIPQVAAGYIATTFGAKWCLVGSIVGSSISGFFIPVIAATLGSKGVMGIRIIQGISQSFMFPSVHAFLGQWIPLQERSRLGTIPYLGTSIGTIVSLLITGYISSSSYGWPVTLYIFGGSGLTVAVLVAYFGASSPDDDPSITEEEKYYIKSNITEHGCEINKDMPIPWSEMFTSLPFIAMVMAHIGYSWSSWTLLFETPIYMNQVMKFDLKSNSLLSSLPYMCEAGISMVYSFIADFLIVKKICSVGTTRKVMNFYGFTSQGLFMFLLAQCDSSDATKAIIYLTAIGITSGALKSGYNVNQIDLSPNYAGILMGISNCISTAVSSFGPLVVQLLVTDEADPSQWRFIFYTSAAICISCLVFNLIFSSGSVQPWNEGSRKIRERCQEVPLKV